MVIDLGNGVYAAMAHLRRDSIRVTAGDRVTAGRPIAECGNSGNSTEPHLHVQLMDGPDPATARGLPFEWRYREDDGGDRGDGGRVRVGVPKNLSRFIPADAGDAGADAPDAAAPVEGHGEEGRGAAGER